MRHRFTRLVAAAIALACAAPAAAAPAQDIPQIVTLSRDSVRAPAGLYPTCVNGPGGLNMQTSCPALRFDTYTTWAMSRTDNEDGLRLVTYDPSGAVVRDLTTNATRYLYKVTVDPAAQTATFWGQGDSRAELRWSDIPRPVPQVDNIQIRNAPKVIPAGVGPSCGQNELTSPCPVVRYRGATTWFYSYNDNRLAYAVVSYNAAGEVIASKTLAGDRYVKSVTANAAARTFTVVGQHNIAVTLPWADLP